MSSKIYKIILVMTIAALILSACQPVPPQPTSQPPATGQPPVEQIPTATPETTPEEMPEIDDGAPLPPQVVGRLPDGAQELATDGAIRLAFDQAMDTAKTATAFQVSSQDGEPVNGKVSWPDERTLEFQPSARLESGSLYLASLGKKAISAQGVALNEPYDFQFLTAGDLQVTQVFPLDGAQAVSSSAVITVIFNRPVVPLGTVEQAADLPDPLTLSPATAGKGEWVSTSVFAFQPETTLKGNQEYTATVKAGLADATGESVLGQDYTWKFTTASPAIESFSLSDGRTNPEDNTRNVLLDEYFTIRFLQPMDQVETESALSLTTRNGEKALLTTEWNEPSTQVVVTPTQRLAIEAPYTLRLDTQAKAADGGTLAEGLDWNFSTVPYPAIIQTNPANGRTQNTFSVDFYIKFASPMRIDTVKPRIQVSPKPEKEIEWYYDEWDWSLRGFFLKPSTQYEIRLLAGMQDIYGNAIQEDQVVRFTTAAYEPSASLMMPYDSPMLRADGPPGTQDFYVAYTNIDSLTLALHSLTAQQFMGFLSGQNSAYTYLPPQSTQIWQAEETGSQELNERVLKSFRPETAQGEPLPPGFYFLGLDSPQIRTSNPYDDYRLVIVANANLTFKSSSSDGLVWLTDLESGQPLAEAPVTIYDDRYKELAGGTTDSDGMLYSPLPEPAESYNPRFALAEDSQVFGFASSGWGSGVNIWDLGIWSDFYAPANRPTAYVYTERPIYRPGQPVFFKGIVRQDNDLDYSLPDASLVTVRISSYEEEVYKEELRLSPFGSFDGKFTLDNEAALGYYTIEAYLPGEETSIGSVTFNVAEYRKPEFQVTVEAGPQNLLPGDSFTAQVQADYYSGGGVAGAEVAWTLTSEPFFYTPPADLSGYSFTDLEDDLYGYQEYGGPSSETIAEGKGYTTENGNYTITLPANLSDDQRAYRLTFEATVTDLAQTAVSGRAAVIAHRSQVYPGIRPQSYVGTEGQEQAFEVVALDWDGVRLPGQALSVEIVERRWYSVQEQDASGRVTWKSSVEEIPLQTFDDLVADDNGEAIVRFTPPKGGIYRARVTALDTLGNPGRASAYMWVAGKEYIPWQQTNDRGFELVTDKKSYLPGETAQILIASPFQGETYALVTVERGRIRSQEVLLLTNNSTIYNLPIGADLAPNVYISVMVVKGVDETNPRPNFKMGITEIQVDTREQTLSVEVTPDRETAGPGEQVQYTVRTSDAQGQPVSAEVSLGLSDLATLSLLPPNSPPILDHFYSSRSLGVQTSVPIVLSLDEYNFNIQEDLQQGAAAGSGGGKGEGELGVVEVRQDFPDTAFWQADVVTNAEGEATILASLPDNLTTWRMDARAVTKETRVGQTTQDLISTLPLLVRPQTPRFFVANDEATLGAAVHNNTGQDLSVTVLLEAEGVSLNSSAEQNIEIPAGTQAYATWQVTVNPDAQRVDLVFSAEGGEFKDASRPPQGTLDNQGIPVYRYEARETAGTSGQMNAGGNRVEGILLPQTIQVSEGELTVRVSPSLAASMTDSLTYLEHFPYECIEQTISSFLPNVLSTQAMKAAGLSDPELEANLKEQVGVALQSIYSGQNPDGGWGWWSRDKSDPLTSAYVVLGLVEAQTAGYTVSESVIQRGLNYLRVQIEPIVGLTEPYLVNRQAFLLYVLARAAKPDVSSTVQLYDQRQRMGVYALAFLTQALYWIDDTDPRLKTLLSDLSSLAIVSASGTHWEEKEIDRWNWNTDTRTTAIVLATLSLIDPSNPINANAARWLMSHRTEGHWQGTQETAWTLMALTHWMVASGELEADYEYAVALNGEEQGSGVANNETLRQTQEMVVNIQDMLQDELNRLAFARSAGPGNLYYTAHLNVALPVEQVQALDQGIVVSRSYYRLDDTETPVTQAKQGEQLLVRLTIVASHALHYVIVEDPLPAGLEAVDQSLSTSPQSVEVPQAYGWEDVFWRGWGWWLFNHIEYRDEKVVLSSDFLPAGTYIYTYLARAGTPGVFRTIPITAQEFYFPEVYGRGDGSLFTVKR
jgi:alpha-2-macroglobulin